MNRKVEEAKKEEEQHEGLSHSPFYPVPVSFCHGFTAPTICAIVQL